MLAVVILAVAAPLLLVLAVLVLFSPGRPVFYSLERVGRYGRHFQCHKLRTMLVDADARLQVLLLEDADALGVHRHPEGSTIPGCRRLGSSFAA